MMMCVLPFFPRILIIGIGIVIGIVIENFEKKIIVKEEDEEEGEEEDEDEDEEDEE